MRHFSSVIILAALGAIIMSGCTSATRNTEITGTDIAETTVEVTNKENSLENSESTTKLEKVEDFEIKVLGTLYQLETSGSPTVTSINLWAYGDRSEINYLDLSENRIRCIFDKGCMIYPKMKCSEKVDDLYVKLYTHHESAAYYRELTISIDDDSAEAITAKAKYNDDGTLSAMILDTEATGYCDVVFIRGTKPVAVVMIKIFEEDGIKKSGKEPSQLMREEIAKTKNDTNETIPETTAKKQTKKKKKK